MGDVWTNVNCLLQKSTHDIGNELWVHFEFSSENMNKLRMVTLVSWLLERGKPIVSSLVSQLIVSSFLLVMSGWYLLLWYQKCCRLDPDGNNIDTWSNSASWWGCRVTSIWKFLTFLKSKCKLISLVNTASSGKETDTYMTPCQQLPSKCSLPLIVSLCTASIIILTFRVPWRPLLTQQKMTLCRTGRPYKNVERTGKWISEEGTRFMWFWSSMKLIFMIQTSKVHY